MIKINFADSGELDKLLTSSEYDDYVKT